MGRYSRQLKALERQEEILKERIKGLAKKVATESIYIRESLDGVLPDGYSFSNCRFDKSTDGKYAITVQLNRPDTWNVETKEVKKELRRLENYLGIRVDIL